MNKDIFKAGSCDCDNAGCFSHEEKLSFGENNLETLKAGSCDCDNAGCFSHKEILMA